MKTKTMFLLIVLLLLLTDNSFLRSQNKTAQREKGQSNSIENFRANFAPDRFLVKFNQNINKETVVNMAKGLDVKFVQRIHRRGIFRIEIEKGKDINAIMEAFKTNSSVEYVEPDFIVYSDDQIPNDPQFSKLWGLHNTGQIVNNTPGTANADIGAPAAWDKITGSNHIIVAIIDAGIAYSHPDLEANIWQNTNESLDGFDSDGNGFTDDIRGWDFVNNDNDPYDFAGHGTHVSGTVAAVGNNGVGITGVAWSAKLMPLRVLGVTGTGYVSHVIEAINYAVQNGARVINASFGSYQYSSSTYSAIEDARNAGVLFVAAAGNAGNYNDSVHHYPSDYVLDNIISVAATDQDDNLASFSNYGLTSVDVGAPGVNIYSTVTVDPSEIFFDDLESGELNWQKEAPWALTTDRHYSSGHSWTDSPAGDYSNNANTSLRLQSPISLVGFQGAKLSYRLWLQTESGYDGIFIEGSIDATNWIILQGYTGSTDGLWFLMEEDLSQFDNQSSVYIRFRFKSDFSNTYDGAYIDDITISAFPPPPYSYDGTEYEFYHGTSMATPQVAGLAALILSKDSTKTYSQVRTKIFESVDPLSNLSGMVSTGGRINAHIATLDPPEITVNISPDPFDFILDLGDNTTGTIDISNTGEAPLTFQISNRDSSSSIAGFLFIDIPAPISAFGGKAAINGSPPLQKKNAIRHDITGEYLLENTVNILLIFADNGATILQTLLLGYPDIGVVDTWLAKNNTGTIPSLSDLLSYDLVVTWNNYPWADEYAIGNLLADFIDTGGKVITLVNCWDSQDPWKSHGRYFDSGYSPFTSLGAPLFTEHILGWYNSDHAIMQGVTSLAITTFYNNLALSPGAELVAEWDDTTPLAATKLNTVAINIYSGDGYNWTGDFPTLIHNSINYLIGRETTWISFTPIYSKVPSDSTISVTAKVLAHDGLVPDSTYSKDIIISSDDPDENPVIIPATLTVNAANYYFSITPKNQSSTSIAGDTLNYIITENNQGLLSDSYSLATSDNIWPTTFWETSGTTLISNTGSVASGAAINIMVKVEIPNSTVFGDGDSASIHFTSVGDPSLSRLTTTQTTSVGMTATIPWSDNFPTTTLDPAKWINNSGPVEVNDIGLDEPSPSYSLNLNGDTTGGDEVRSVLIDLSGDSLVILSYYYQRTGGGNSPESGEDLWIDYQNSSGVWVNLKQYAGSGLDMNTYELDEIVLPENAYHYAFRIRFRCAGTTGSYGDDWFVDDVSITRPPIITVEPESYDVFVRVNETKQGSPLVISNTGQRKLHYQIISIPSGGSTFNRNFKSANRDYPANYYSMNLAKGVTDNRKGAPAGLNSGGPDNFGYYWIDSDEAGGPVFQWEDISTVGTQITGINIDSNVGPFPIGFSFPFYGSNFTSFRFCTNGFISFTSPSDAYTNRPIPNQTVYNLIAPFWDDLNFNISGSPYYHNDGEKLIIQYDNVVHYSSGGPYTFEILIYPDGRIVFQYLNMQSSLNSATVGIQNEVGTDGLEIAFNTSYIHDNLAVLIATHIPWIQFTHENPLQPVPQDSTISIPVLFNARDIDVNSVLYANIVIISNDSANPSIVIPVEMSVYTNETITGTIQGAGNPLAGAIVQVWDDYPNGPIIDSDTTETDGLYLFELPLDGGIYTIRAYATECLPILKEGVAGNTQNVNLTLQPVPEVTPTTESVFFFSDNTKFRGSLVKVGDVITAEDPDNVVCGKWTVTTTGNYGLMPVYKDDFTTPDIDEGAETGDIITFKINGLTANTLGPDSPIWLNRGSISNVDLKVDPLRLLNIPLSDGWNLVSWNVDTPNDSTEVILSEIISNVHVVLGYEQGGLTYDPALPHFSSLLVMDHLHGYWIKMDNPDTLIVTGFPFNFKQTPIYCESGWNLVSYLPEDPDSVSHALTTIIDKATRVYGFKNEAFIYDPDLPQFSTLHILSETSGYWVNLTEDDTLNFPQPLPGVPLPSNVFTLSKIAHGLTLNKGTLIPTNEWVSVFGDNIKLNGQLMPVETEVKAFDPDQVLCGEFIVNKEGSFGFMHIYRDDPHTKLDEGAEPGDEITIYINNIKLPFKVSWKSFGEVIDLSALITSLTGELRSIPDVYNLSQNYPNPFNPETTLNYQLPEDALVILKIYNLLGQKVRTLINDNKEAGYYRVIWDGLNDEGKKVTSGIYIYMLQANDFKKTRKMLNLK